MYIRLNSRDHMIQDTAVARFLRRKTGDQDVFTYFHKKTKKWVAASWINRNGKVCYEHFLWEGGPQDCSVQKVLGFVITRSDAYRAWLKETAVKCRLYEKDLEDDAITYAEEQAALFDFHKRRARCTLQGHYSWWDFPKQDRRVG